MQLHLLLSIAAIVALAHHLAGRIPFGGANGLRYGTRHATETKSLENGHPPL